MKSVIRLLGQWCYSSLLVACQGSEEWVLCQGEGRLKKQGRIVSRIDIRIFEVHRLLLV